MGLPQALGEEGPQLSTLVYVRLDFKDSWKEIQQVLMLVANGAVHLVEAVEEIVNSWYVCHA